jgi:hypothetical protein
MKTKWTVFSLFLVGGVIIIAVGIIMLVKAKKLEDSIKAEGLKEVGENLPKSVKTSPTSAKRSENNKPLAKAIGEGQDKSNGEDKKADEEEGPQEKLLSQIEEQD